MPSCSSSGRRAAYTIKAGTTCHSAGYGLELGRIERLFDGNVPAPLRDLLAPEVAASRIVAMRGNRFMSSLAAALFACGLNGPLRLLMIEGAVISSSSPCRRRRLTTSQPGRRRPGLTIAEREALHAARTRLLADMRHPPTLGDLALAVGLTEKRLNAGFKQLFGTTVFETLRNERLEHARIALQSDKVTLKEIAFRVGYNHVPNFASAFAARYGAPPRQYQ